MFLTSTHSFGDRGLGDCSTLPVLRMYVLPKVATDNSRASVSMPAISSRGGSSRLTLCIVKCFSGNKI